MKVLQCEDGFYALESNDGNPDIPKGKVRVYSATVRVEDIDEADADKEFATLIQHVENNPQFARALLLFLDAVGVNREAIEEVGGRLKQTTDPALVEELVKQLGDQVKKYAGQAGSKQASGDFLSGILWLAGMLQRHNGKLTPEMFEEAARKVGGKMGWKVDRL